MDGAELANMVHSRLETSRARLARQDAAVLADQVAVTRIPAPTGDESERAAWISTRFAALGLVDVRTDEAGNVAGQRPGRDDRRPVAICAHLDTVFPRTTNLQIRREAHRLIGPGITDNARGLAVMLAIAEETASDRLPLDRPIEFVATTGEEGVGDLRGAKHYFASRGRDASAAIIIDGAGDERIVHRALGSRRFRVAVDGPGGHSWSAFGVANPLHAIAAAAHELSRIPLPTEPRTTLTVARIGGGLSVNSIPASAWMEIDLRSTSMATLESVQERLFAIIRGAIETENGRRSHGSAELVARVDMIGDRPCGETPIDHPLVVAAGRITRLIGRNPELASASTDANVPISLGVPAIAIGAGGQGGDTHTAAEWYDNTAGSLGIARALSIVAVAASLGNA
jgi:acetylornithine deacetylase/succinyl-diaminopimelate desuccinylase-like protein